MLNEPVVNGIVRIRLTFDPERLWLLPTATLETVSGSPSKIPLHRFGEWFCYLDPETVEWNPESSDFIGHVVCASDRVVSELHRLQKGKEIREQDSEFTVHWAGKFAYLDIPEQAWPPRSGTSLTVFKLSRPELKDADPINVIALSGKNEGERYSGFDLHANKQLLPCVSVKLTKYPFASWDDWPPTTLAQLNRWIRSHRPAKEKATWRELARVILPQQGRPSSALILIETQAGRFGAVLEAGPRQLAGFRPGAKLAERLRGSNNLTRSLSISRWAFERLDDDFVLTRNSPSESAPLAGKHIHLLGAGSIGGSLADLLVQAGAGRNCGSLHIFDPQVLRAENCGRHLLGVTALGRNKATAVVERLRRERLVENVWAHPCAAGDPKLHKNADLVIDATAAPNVGAHLSNHARWHRSWALISVSVEGEGWVASTHLYRGVAGESCRECLEPWIGGRGSHIPKGCEPEQRDGGCGSRYTPYRAAAACMAASLASELACDWALGNASKLFRAVKMPSAPRHVKAAKYWSPKSLPGCICATKCPSGTTNSKP
ncbi:ThiF family adenylyltransferase [Salinisphaera aquimarina]|uniref:ThiF family adenylyltransferase n=1 Tax=Salinisphaera aquimarina TaxID=2094031 RepID=A0ABV7ESC9_9GAMM